MSTVTNGTIAKRAAIFGAAGFALCFFLCALAGLLTAREALPEQARQIVGLAALILSALSAPLVAAKSVDGKKMVIALATAAMFSLCLIALALAAIPEAFPTLLRSILIVFGAGMLGGFLGTKRKKRRKY
ncbi:MAG: TIGR04086 family membrane protein [Oscillospiraceae bacterium]|nr:TIGR04086 family membrane protein [Oscillospiraceae bacterium]